MRTLQENGKTFVLIPLKEYERMIGKGEMAADVAAFDAATARAEESFPIALFDAVDAGQNPVAVFRRHRGMNQLKLAKATGLSAAYLSQIENGTRKGSVKALRLIAKALDVPMDLLA